VLKVWVEGSRHLFSRLDAVQPLLGPMYNIKTQLEKNVYTMVNWFSEKLVVPPDVIF